ncbi:MULTISPECIES: hypothetical protein [Ramlibacter]|uniref:Integral membrane protein n=1 Tax=Ramlibacter pinisoli TaxID=2682844 RepID=A0A6N8IQS7_9BURK|nr:MULTISPECIES: hypothetical protein [Ramlibacter]MBA2964106.1 hypothetical protein [Ramlibacter sp. CGMCC 1.13660]MVQ29072.1 hypothetical protein [Ramlibacter pinisoli]
MSESAATTFLRRVLWADAASCLACAAAQLAAPDLLAGLLGLPRALLLGTGLFLALYALAVGWTAGRPRLPLPLVVAFAAGNVGWALASAALLASGAVRPTALGLAWVAAQAATVLVLAALQGQGWRALRAPVPA